MTSIVCSRQAAHGLVALAGVVLAVTALTAGADSVTYTLRNLFLSDGAEMTGHFRWVYPAGEFDNGEGFFTALDVPYTNHDQSDLSATIDPARSIEITLPGSVHDDGVDITLVLLQPLTPTTSSPIDPALSRYEIGGNGFFLPPGPSGLAGNCN